jgi:CotH kinase protein
VQDSVDAGAKDEFFDQPMYMVEITGWPRDDPRTDEPVASSGAARLALWRTDPADPRHIPPPGADGVLFSTGTFSLVNSGNRTLHADKRSWKINFDVAGGEDRVAGMSKLNLKSMCNDPSQMREALAWRLFRSAGVPAARHSYAKLAINGRYLGLFSLIEQVDKRFLADHFGKNHRGNLYKAYCGDIGCATLEHRVGPDGDDGGRQYNSPGSADQTYRLQTNEDDPAANSYDDLARFIRVINGVGLPGGDQRFGSDAFRDSVEGIMNVRGFLRWAGVNILLGSWDNYFATPANYYLYNSGRAGGDRDFASDPYFTFIPWDYDNSLGIDYVGTRWQYTDLLDWAGNTAAYWGNSGKTSRIPLVANLLRNHDLCQYYLDHLEHLLDTTFNLGAISAAVAPDRADGLWERVCHAAYLESDTPYGRPFTGRQFSNDEVYLAGNKQNELRHGNAKIEGIFHYVRMRYDSAREQLGTLRGSYPRSASGATFPVPAERLPGRS